MDPVYYVIAILGCADGGSACTPVATMPTHYRNAAQCTAQTSDALTRAAEFDFPTMVAECRGVSARAAETAGEPGPAAPAAGRRVAAALRG